MRFRHDKFAMKCSSQYVLLRHHKYIVFTMGARSTFETIKPLSAAKHGGMNRGVFLVKSKYFKKKYIEKRLGTTQIDAGYGDREVRAMRQCSHPNVIRIADWDLDYTSYGYGSIFMDHCELGSLGDLVHRFKTKNKLLKDEGFLCKVAFGCTLGLCHSWTGADNATMQKCASNLKRVDTVPGWNRIVHRDLKLDNIFLTWADRTDNCLYPKVVIGDFGCCISVNDINTGRARGYHRTSGGTPAWDPPEAPAADEKSDAYQLGLILHCLARMISRPFLSCTDRAEQPLPAILRDPGLSSIVKKLLRKDPHRRPTWNDLPALMWIAYSEWRKNRKNDGEKLPFWAFDQHYVK
jgi:serine/threonine protein kinase